MFNNLSKVIKILSAQMGIKPKYLCSKTHAISLIGVQLQQSIITTMNSNPGPQLKLSSPVAVSHISLLLTAPVIIHHFISIWVIIFLMSNTFPSPLHTHTRLTGPSPLWTGTIYFFPHLYTQRPAQST